MLYLRDALYLDSETFTMTRTHLAVEAGAAGSVTPVAAIPPVADRAATDSVFDCKGRIATRAFACGHHHIYSALSRGMPPAPKAPANFLEVLEHIWWRLDKCLDKDMTVASALAAGVALAKNGVTFCIDHHASPNAVEGSLASIAHAFDTVGIGHLLCYETSDRDGLDIALKGLAEHEAFFRSGGKGHVGLHASFTVSDETLRTAVDLAQKYGTGIHIHAAEDKSDQEHCRAAYGKSVIRRLKDAGALDLPKTILGHCVHVSDEDRAILAASPCWIAQNVESNCNNNVGLASYSYSKNVMFGTDGMHSDMIRSAQAGYFLGVGLEGQTCAGAYARLRNVHRHAALHGNCGDGHNNLVVLDDTSPTPVHPDNFLGHFFYGLTARDIGAVISQGRLIVAEGRLLSCDEEEILAFAKEQATRLWRKLG
ncbi:Amidohydrolase [uncultured delta proteobacterium]|uniref:Amidohydrolase n=1 Tax=uncultured delta proteobacterium TaxID=34034 RepID=A0A212JBN5_9DELT|nr:Amidohydrolase [uncultured delta proteobacterium]